MIKNKYFEHLFFLNVIIFLINYLLYLRKINNILLYPKINFKNNDNFLLSDCHKTFYEISNELDKKYKIFKNFSNITNDLSNFKNQKLEKKKTIVLYFEDNLNQIYQHLIKKLEINYTIILSSDNPDYLIYNVFGCHHLKEKYKNSIKIAIYSENQIPDFNIADYAIGQHHIHYLDRYFKFPCILNTLRIFKHLDYIRQKNIIINTKSKFCAAVISNYKYTDNFRANFIKELDKYKKVDMGGKYLNNVGIVNNKVEFLSSYKFSIAMENTEGDGYASEKIIESFVSGTIPIYYGDYMIEEYINPKSFILIRGEKDMMEKIDYIKKIDNDDKLYIKILKENILIDYNIPEKISNEYYDFFMHIFEQDKMSAKRNSIRKTFN